MLSGLSNADALLLLCGALGIGVSKSGFPGVSMLHVVFFAMVFGAKESTGILLPMLIVGDVCAIKLFGRKADWSQIRKLLPPTLVGIVIGAAVMHWIATASPEVDSATRAAESAENKIFSRIVGAIILSLTIVQITRMFKPKLFDHIPHQAWFSITLGLLAGLTTMLANAAGPVVALYLLAVSLPKMKLIGTSAWLFLVLNCFKVPFSYQLGLISIDTLQVGLTFCLAIPVGMLFGRWLVNKVPQLVFNSLLLAFTAIAAVRMLS